jgi:DNA-binding NarL/FixJ family response regulator
MTTENRRGAANRPTLGSAELTPAQLRVFMLASSGRQNKQIAFDLGIAEATVKAHMTAVMRKLNVHTRTQAAMAAQAMNLEGGVEAD